MGALLAVPALFFSAFCCCLQGLACVCTLASCISCCFSSAMGKRTGVSPRLAKVFYVVILALCTILALVLRFNSSQFDLGYLSASCADGLNGSSTPISGTSVYVYCKGVAAVYRISFVLVCFFALLLVLSLCSEKAHRGFWFFKVLLIVGGLVGCFFMTEDSFNSDQYAWFARFASIIFLVLQILVLIDFAYQWNEDWVARAYQGVTSEYEDATQKNWLVFILLSAVALYGASIAGLALIFVYYSSCSTGMGYAVWTVLAVVGMTVLSLFRDKIVGVEGAILPSAVVSAYAVYLCWSALESNPDASCRPSQQTTATIIIGCFIAAVCLAWTTFSITENAGHLVKGEELEKPTVTGAAAGGANGNDLESGLTKPTVAAASSSSASPGAASPTSSGNANAGRRGRGGGGGGGGPIYRNDLDAPVAVQEDEDDEPVFSNYKPWVFHLIMVSASAYLAMLLTDWGSVDAAASSDLTGSSSMWIKISAQIVTILLFVWTLVAPGVLPDRDFA